MGVRWPGVFSTAVLNSPIITTAETIVVTSPPLNLSLDFQAVLLFAYVNAGFSTGTNGGTFRIRRGTLLTSPIVNSASLADNNMISNSQQSKSLCYVDTGAGAAGGLQYSLTVQLSGATSNTVLNDVYLLAMAI